MGTNRRQQMLLGALILIFAIVGYRSFSTPSAVPLPASNGTATAAPRRTAQTAPTAPDVHLDALEAERPEPVSGSRDLFRFKSKAAPGPKPTAPAIASPAPTVPTGPPGPPPLPAIPYKFIGLVETAGSRRIAVLSDGKGLPVHGREGDIIEGRYRIVRIGAESVEMEYLDGRGRQTIRLSGS